jgi:hypothetical protein
MRKIFLHIGISLDGFIEDADRQIDWHFDDDEFEEYINGVLGSIDSMIFGRKAFEPLADYWPTAEENPVAAADPKRPERHIEAARMMNAKERNNPGDPHREALDQGERGPCSYELEPNSGGKFRNSEFIRCEAGKIGEIEVYFGSTQGTPEAAMSASRRRPKTNGEESDAKEAGRNEASPRHGTQLLSRAHFPG